MAMMNLTQQLFVDRLLRKCKGWPWRWWENTHDTEHGYDVGAGSLEFVILGRRVGWVRDQMV